MNFYTINRGLSRRLHLYFSYQSTKVQYRSKINRLIKNHNCKPLSKFQVNEIKDYYASFGFKNINTNWHRFFTHVNGKYYKEYIPEDLFYNVIIPYLNMVRTHTGLVDKNLLSKLFRGIKQPETIVKNINGIFYNEKENTMLQINDVVKKCSTYSKLIIKPSIDSGGGKNVVVFNVNNNKTDYDDMTLDDLIKSYRNNFIIQKLIIQHEQMSLLNPNSVNTLRFTSLLINGEVEILSTMVRIGAPHSRVDNTSQGGIWCNIKAEGLLNEKGYDKQLKYVFETGSKVRFFFLKIPNYHKVIEELKHLHLQIPYFKYISWDLAIDEFGETVLIEYNVLAPGIEGQVSYGPLFGKFTSEILNDSGGKRNFN